MLTSNMLKVIVIFFSLVVRVLSQDLETILSSLYTGVGESGTTGQALLQTQTTNNYGVLPSAASRATPGSHDWGLWGQYSTCSVTCGIGQQRRQRVCYYYPARTTSRVSNNFNSILLPLLLGGNSRSSLLALSLLGNGAGQNTGGYGTIRTGEVQGSATLSGGADWNAENTASNLNVEQTQETACPGNVIDYATCYQPDCPEPTIQPKGCLSSWGEFGQCSTTCGRGFRYRTRTCNCRDSTGKVSCSEILNQSRRCNNNRECIEEAPWGAWGPYGRCSTTCGPGTKTRFRVCSQPTKCVGESVLTEACETSPCATAPPIGSWGAWGAYDTCTTTCGPGAKSRYRVCVGRGKCVGSMMESTSCGNNACPTIPPAGQWGNWGPYSSCTNTCQTGTKTRIRICIGNGECEGLNMETVSCQNEPCPQPRIGFWSSYGQWGECKMDMILNQCYQERFRFCVGDKCEGSRSERRECSDGECAQFPSTTPTVLTTKPNQIACDASFPEKRRDCGFAGISREECWERGCCFSDVIYGATWCFYDDFSQESVQPKAGS